MDYFELGVYGRCMWCKLCRDSNRIQFGKIFACGKERHCRGFSEPSLRSFVHVTFAALLTCDQVFAH